MMEIGAGVCPKCVDSRNCFGRNRLNPSLCGLLMSGYEKNGQCKFCKPKRGETNGVYYPHRDDVRRMGA